MPARTNQQVFSRVKIARELLLERADEIINSYLEIAKLAKEQGDYKTASEALQWLISRMPGDAEGTKVVDASLDKAQVQQQQPDTRPMIQIGIQVGGLNKNLPPAPAKELPPAEVIDAE
jgi:cytochrome c-type biogenesis protein CcmH/NrfG